MTAKINHKAITDVLVRNGFYQLVQHRTAGWVHKCGMVVYYTSHKGLVCYLIRYKLDDYEVKTETELTNILYEYIKKGIL